jgi:TolA-binding protein
MDIYFCEKCGVSVPLPEVMAGRAVASDGKVYCSQHLPGSADGDLELYFCDTCGVSIPLQDVITGTAQTGGEKTVCATCSRKQKAPAETEDRFRLYFCDSCNTSVPQSHVVTGRAAVRGGKTYCENCRDRVARRVSPLVPVIGILVLAVAALGVVLLAGGGAKEPAGPDPLKVLAETESVLAGRIDAMDQAGKERAADFESRLRAASDGLVEKIRGLEAKIADLEGRAAARADLDRKVQALEAEVARLRPLEEQARKLEAMEEEIRRLRTEVGRTPAAPLPEPAPAAPPAAEPAPEPAADIPEDVRVRIDRLASPDSGIRFSAAVELGKKGHPAAVPALAKLLADDEDLFVRRAAARALGEIRETAAVPALIEALLDKEIYVALQASKSLQAITGKEFGFKDKMSLSQRRQVQNRWKKWWKDHDE